MNTSKLLRSAALCIGLLSSSAWGFTDLSGTPTSLSAHIGNGKWTVVEVWKSDCGACRQHMPSFVAFDGKLDNTRLLGISLDGLMSADAQAMIDEFEIPFPTLLSDYAEVNAWLEETTEESLIGTPTFLIFNPQGEVLAAQAGIVSTAALEKFILANSQ